MSDTHIDNTPKIDRRGHQPRSPETRKKMSVAHKARWANPSPEALARAAAMGRANRGRRIPYETRVLIAESHRRNGHTPTTDQRRKGFLTQQSRGEGRYTDYTIKKYALAVGNDPEQAAALLAQISAV